VNPAEQAHQFFDALLGGNGELLTGQYLTISSFASDTSKPQTRWVPARVDSLASAAIEVAEGNVTGVYAGVGLTRGRASGAGRLTVDSTTGITFINADIDIAGPGHQDKPYVPDLESAVSLAHGLGLPPTLIVATGHGIQPAWRLNEPWIFGATDVDDDGVPIIDESKVAAERAAAAQLTWEFVTSMRIRAKQRGNWHMDPTGDLARLVRIPGSHNRKLAGENLPVHIIEHTGARYDREQFEAAMAPRSLLDPYRRSSNEAATVLAGTDLAGLWVEVKSSPGFVPFWLSSALESGWDDALCRIWSGADDKRYDNDDSAIDQALVAAVLRLDLGVELAAQAVMARRLRIDRKVEKADPAERGDYYLDLTIRKVVGRIAERVNIAESAQSVIDAALAPEPATQVGMTEPTSNENAVALEGEPEPEPATVTPLRRTQPDPEPDPEVEHAAAPRSPRQGIDPSTPAPPTPTEQNTGKLLAGQLGLPQGVAIWAVGERRLEKTDEFRMWLLRDSTSQIRGGTWRPNTVRATRWRPKSEWEVNTKVRGILMRDLHLQIEPVPARAWSDEGLPRLYDMARPMDEGTPAEMARQSIVGLLRRAAGTARFSTAVTTRDPWLCDDKVWVALDSIRIAISQAGFAVQSAVKLMDTLDEMGCKVQTGMNVIEELRTVRDELPWVLLAEDMFSDELAAHVRLRAADRDAQEARAGLRQIGPS
jgi:hypothetical protein